jgi:2-dehydro-3-deoxyphosphogluconate aldolase/(4S)-4-hydroxy-2-oxoglutarate aldolase
MPWTSIMPTGGVELSEESLGAWWKAGVACVGMGSNLITAELLKRQDYAGITANVKRALAMIGEARQRR